MSGINPTINEEDDMERHDTADEMANFPYQKHRASRTTKNIFIVLLIVFLLAAIGGIAYMFYEDTKKPGPSKPQPVDNTDGQTPVDVDPTDNTKPGDTTKPGNITDPNPPVIDEGPESEPYHEY